MEILVFTIIGTVIGTVLAIEAKAWMPYVGFRLVRATLERMPEGLEEQICSRWAEEIEADHAALADRPIGGLMFAVRLRLKGGRRLAGELALHDAVVSPRALGADRQPMAGWTKTDQQKARELLATALYGFFNVGDSEGGSAAAVEDFGRDLHAAFGAHRARLLCLGIAREFSQNPGSYVPDDVPGQITEERLRAMAVLLLRQAQEDKR